MTIPRRPAAATRSADIIACVLKMNGYAAGAGELTFDPDVLKQISLKK